MRIDRSSLSSLFFPSNKFPAFEAGRRKIKKETEKRDAAEGWDLRWKGAREIARMFPAHEESTDYRARISSNNPGGNSKRHLPCPLSYKGQGPVGPLEGEGTHTVIRHSARRRETGRGGSFHEVKIFVEGGTISLLSICDFNISTWTDIINFSLSVFFCSF